MKTLKQIEKNKVKRIMTASVVVMALIGCGRNPNKPSEAVGAPTVKYKQIERLGRPAINEGLVVTNDYLNAFNSIPPSLDLTPAASKVVDEAASVLGLINKFAKANFANSTSTPPVVPPEVSDVAGGFLPDVLRIDTSANIAVGQSAYNGDFTTIAGKGSAILTGGRKIEDDVIDITLSYLFAGNPGLDTRLPIISDHVSYDGGAANCLSPSSGSNLGNPGHKCLVGQNSRLGAAVFPFLAEPN